MGFPILDEKLEDNTILSCFDDVKILVCSWCCGCCTLARIRAGIRGDKEGFTLAELLTSWCLYPCCLFKTRTDFRSKYKIELEKPFLDQLLSCWCCSICSLSQMARKMNKENELPPLKIIAK